MDQIKATMPKSDTSNAYNHGNDKELVSRWLGIGKAKGELYAVVDIRCWMGRSKQASTVYASIWVNGKKHWFSGKGSAGGYGYHKESAAIDGAIRSAGITLDKSIQGVGDSAIREAIQAIGRALKVKLTIFN